MRKIPPSARVREEIGDVLSRGVDAGGNIVSTLAELGVRYVDVGGAARPLLRVDASPHGRRYRRARARQTTAPRTHLHPGRVTRHARQLIVRLNPYHQDGPLLRAYCALRALPSPAG